MTTQDHAKLVTAQFGPRAAAYVASTVHAGGADLEQLAAFAARGPAMPAPSTLAAAAAMPPFMLHAMWARWSPMTCRSTC